MKKLMVAVAVMLAVCFGVSAQEEGGSSSGAIDFTSFGGTVKSGNIIVDAGLGIDSGSFQSMGYYIPRISVSGEYTLQCGPCPLGFGLAIDYMANRSYGYYVDEISSANRITQIHNNLFIALVVNYHVNIPALDAFDFYVGPRIGVCLDIVNQDDYHYDTNAGAYITDNSSFVNPAFYAGGVIGASWYLTEMIGANVEVGYPTLARAGVSLKF